MTTTRTADVVALHQLRAKLTHQAPMTEPTILAAGAAGFVQLVRGARTRPALDAKFVPTGRVSETITADADSDPVTVTVSDPAHGSVALDPADGTYVYTPDAGYAHSLSVGGSTTAGLDPITFTATDSHGAPTSTTVTASVAPFNRAPTADPIVGDPTPDPTGPIGGGDDGDPRGHPPPPPPSPGAPVPGEVRGTINGNDLDDDTLTYTLTAGTTTGTVTVDPVTGAFSYKPTAAARHATAATTDADTAAFTVTITDGHGGSTPEPVTVTIAPKNAAPTSTAVPTVGEPNAAGLLTGSLNIINTDSDTLSYTVTGQPGKGSVSVDANGIYTYTPLLLHAWMPTTRPVTMSTASPSPLPTVTAAPRSSPSTRSQSALEKPSSPAPRPPAGFPARSRSAPMAAASTSATPTPPASRSSTPTTTPRRQSRLEPLPARL